MGEIREGTCPQCGYQARLFTGGGRQDCMPEAALLAGHQDPGLAAALKEGAQFQINRQVAVCHQCQKLQTASSVSYQRPGGKQYTIADRCPDCGGALEYLSLKSDQVPCPVCGNRIRLERTGLWD